MTSRTTTAIDYVEDVSPGSGALPPRAWYASSDAKSLSLNGSWRLRVSPAVDAEDDSFAEPGFDAGGWPEVTVPGHWVLQGDGAFGLPIQAITWQRLLAAGMILGGLVLSRAG